MSSWAAPPRGFHERADGRMEGSGRVTRPIHVEDEFHGLAHFLPNKFSGWFTSRGEVEGRGRGRPGGPRRGKIQSARGCLCRARAGAYSVITYLVEYCASAPYCPQGVAIRAIYRVNKNGGNLRKGIPIIALPIFRIEDIFFATLHNCFSFIRGWLHRAWS